MTVVAPERPQQVKAIRRFGRWLVRRIGQRPQRRTTSHPLAILPSATLLLGVGVAISVAPGGSTLGRILRLFVVLLATICVARYLRGGPLDRRAAIACGIGILGTVVGFGIGVAHAMTNGLTVRSGAALVVLLVSVSMIVGGGRTVWRALGTPRRWLVAVVTPVALILIWSPLVDAVTATNPPTTKVGNITPGDRGHPYDDVTLVTADGVHLRGWYVPSHNGVALAMVPSAGSTRSGLLGEAMVLADYGYGVLLFDTRGNGASDGDAMDLGWSGELDVRAAVSYLAAQDDVDRSKIGVIGVGRGGEAAITAAASDPRISAVVAEGLGRRAPGDALMLRATPANWLQGLRESVEYVGVGVLRHSLPPPVLRGSVAAMAPRRLMIIAERGEILAGRLYLEAAPGSVTLWQLPNTPPMQAFDAMAPAWEEHVTTYLERTLLPRPVPGERQ
ncbi:alpha/beta hydrolase [Actinopolymorpha alba]|uniref:alpha/beta hydrolase n=1 Tax=Actinopolymorpha alba TaxID=533267 RepID=UPI00036EB36D|nr:CocE/NonD family hydrolase [Actinopolymorpha alba]